MKKIILILSLLISINYVSAAEIPVKIKPAQIISTCHDEIEIGDNIRFKIVNDVYKDNKLYIAKDTPIIGKVEYVAENGWTYDNAQIDIKYFKTKDLNGNIIKITSPMSINGFEILKFKGKRIAQFFNYCGVALRGKEIEILPDKDKNITFNIWLNRVY